VKSVSNDIDIMAITFCSEMLLPDLSYFQQYSAFCRYGKVRKQKLLNVFFFFMNEGTQN